MFFPERMQRIRLLVHGQMKERVVTKLHELGAVQITDYRHNLSKQEWKELLEPHPVSPDVRKITTQLMTITRLLDVFSMVDPEEEEGFFKQMFAPSQPEIIPVEDISGEKLFEEVSNTVSSVESEITDSLEGLEKIEMEKSNLEAQKNVINRIKSINLPLETLGESAFVNVVLGIAPNKDFHDLKSEIEKITNSVSFFAESGISESETCLLGVSLVSDADEVSTCLRKWDVEKITPDDFKGSPVETMVKIDKRMAVLEEEQNSCREKIKGSAKQRRSRLKALRELLMIERERAEIYSSFAKTETVTAVEGWITKKQSSKIVVEIENCCEGLAMVKLTEPDEPDEKLPVKLDNPGILKHFELLVKLYAMPKYDEIDPTVLIFPSFLFFFGLMITDAMYGVMTLLLGVFILRGGGKYYPLYKSAGLLLVLGGASTVVLGGMTGGWFGNFATDYLGMKFFNNLVVLNPMIDVSNFLLFAIGVGIVHLNIGIVLGIIKNVRRNNIPEALKHVWIFFLEISLVFYYFNATTPALIFVVPALLLLFYAEKGMALFGVTGLLGDSLSYARLMALGLVSFGLAVAINALAKMVLSVSYVGWLIAILIFIFGHLFSFVLNLMGAFAHGIRLHFVEFFGKFYSGGGDVFEPFSIKREITEEASELK